MTTVNSTTPVTTNTANAAATAAATSSQATVGYNDFLNLLIAQLKNQDPTSPADPTQFVAQLATFSQVEQQVQTNSKLSTMLTTSALSQADGIIGKTVTSADGTTTGVISSVTIASDGSTTGTTSSGLTIPLINGITIS